jgi:ribonucleotide reductase alpha subunit
VDRFNIQEIPANIREIYKTVWELKQRELIDQSADRAPYICQTQSLNLFFEEPSQKVLTSATVYAWKRGLKTGSYYIRSRPRVQAQQVTVDPRMKVSAAAAAAPASEPAHCESCSA